MKIEALTSWPDPAYFVHGLDDTLPTRHSVDDQMACLVFESLQLGESWIRAVADSFEMDFELIAASVEDCFNILSHMKRQDVSLIWLNPPALATFNAVLHDLDVTLALLRQIHDA